MVNKGYIYQRERENCEVFGVVSLQSKLQMKMHVTLELVLLAILMLQYHCASAATYYPEQTVIEGTDEKGTMRQYTLTQPRRYIDCRSRDPCPIVLNITYMYTMTTYNYNSTVDAEFGGRRGDDEYIVNITSSGMLQFNYPNSAPSANRELLYPILADGSRERRLVIAINNQVPGPTIIGRNGQTLQVTVVNSLFTESLSIHWHGQDSIKRPWMDGVAQITQCPITPYTNFTYELTLDTAGTHWYHGHFGAQRTDGLFGALIVMDDSELAGADVSIDFEDLPEQHTLTFIDWHYLQSTDIVKTISSGFPDPLDSAQIYKSTLIYGGSSAGPVPFVSGLINGAGWRYTPDMATCMRESEQNTPLAVFNVTTGSNYRFRLIGAQNTFAFRFSIEGHNMTLLASDGTPVKETKSNQMGLDYIVIYGGERYDVLVEANQPSPTLGTGNYWMIAETLENPTLLKDRGYCVDGHRAYALLHYVGHDFPSWPPDTSYNPTERPCPMNAPCYMGNCPFEEFPTDASMQNITCVNVGDMQQRVFESIPNTGVSQPTFLNFGFVGGSSINGRRFLLPPMPPLTQWQELNEIWKDNFCFPPKSLDEPQGIRCMHTYKVEDETVELVLMNYFPNTPINETEAHPIHLHGHHYWIIEVGYGTCNATSGRCEIRDINCGVPSGCNKNVRWSDEKPPLDVSSINRPRKDTVLVPPGGYVVIRFKRDNPGWWFMHCHNKPHRLEGMAMVIDESNYPPAAPEDFPKCGNYPDTSSDRNSGISLSSRIGVGLALGCVAFCVSLQHLLTE